MLQRSRAAVAAVLFLLSVILPLALAAPAAAQDLDALRASGAVGERYDGLAVARDSDYGALVAQVNAQRLEIYQKRAEAQNVPVDQIGRIYAKEIVQKAPKGTWFMTEDGRWRQL